ncbi:MAG: MFS transporter [Firmicutes bacterium]|nr:MFS transporter [Bacillota bacterium]
MRIGWGWGTKGEAGVAGREDARREGESAAANQPFKILALVCLGVFMGALDGSIVNVAFPTLAEYFRVPLTVVGWVTEVYLLTSTTLVTIFGRLSERWGSRRVYLGGFAVFLAGSVLSGMAASIHWLLVFRGLQAVGSAMLVANSVAILAQVFPRQRFGTALGLLETAVSAALVVGPVVGGFLIQALGWRWIFYVNVPIATAAMGLGTRWLPPTPPAPERHRFDWLGALAFGAGLGTLLFGISLIPQEGGVAPPLIAVGAAILAGFLVWERHHPNPMLDLGLFLRRAFSLANGAKVFAYATIFAITFLVPFYLQDLAAYPPGAVGTAMVPLPVALAAGSLVGGPLSDRVGSRLLAPLGLVLAVIGTALFLRVTPGSGYWPLLTAMVVVNFGMGAFIVANDRIIMHSAPREKAGTASGVLAMMRSIGMVLGIALSAALFSSYQAGFQRSGAAFSRAFVLSFHAVFAWAAVATAAGLAMTVMPGAGGGEAAEARRHPAPRERQP